MIKKYTRQWMLSARENERLSLQKLGEIADLAYPSLQKIETGKTVNIKPQTLEKIANALNMLLEDAVMMENEYKKKIQGKTTEPVMFSVWLDPSEVKNGKVTVDGIEYRVELPVANNKILLNLEKE